MVPDKLYCLEPGPAMTESIARRFPAAVLDKLPVIGRLPK
jgi:hypothetical protein